jgi:Carboxymuconolactone decarboxylase family
MNRTVGVQNQEAGLRTRVIFWLAKRRLGRVPLSARIQARDPKLLEAAARMSMHIARPGTVPLKLKELAQLKVAALVGCPF